MRVWALIKRIILQMLRDKRTLALLFLAPLLVLTLMHLIFNGKEVKPTLGVVDVNTELVKMLEKAKIDVVSYPNGANAKTVVDDDLDGLLKMTQESPELILENSDPSISKTLQMKVNQALGSFAQKKQMEQSMLPQANSMQSAASQTNGVQTKSGQNVVPQVNILPTKLDTTYVYGNSDTSIFDVLSPVLVGFFVFFFVFLISGIGLLRERTTGTLERLLSTPIRRSEIVFSYLIGYGIFAVIQTVIVVFYSVNILDMVLVGSIWNVIFINLLLALVALSLGILLSSFASSEFQMVQFIPIVVVPQIFFSGIFPLEGMADWLQSLGKAMPLYYAADALKGIMYKGWGLGDIGRDILALCIFAICFIVLNIFALKKYRTL